MYGQKATHYNLDVFVPATKTLTLSLFLICLFKVFFKSACSCFAKKILNSGNSKSHLSLSLQQDVLLHSPLIEVLCRISKVMSNVPNVQDGGNSCVVMHKKRLMTKHVGDSVSMATRDSTTGTVCEEQRTEDVEAEHLGNSHFSCTNEFGCHTSNSHSDSCQITKDCCRY